MAKIKIDLSLEVIIPQNGGSVNTLVYEIGKSMPNIFFAILKSILVLKKWLLRN